MRNLPGSRTCSNAALFSRAQLPETDVTSTVVDLLLSRFVTFSVVPAGNWLLDAAGAPPSPESVTVEPLQTCWPPTRCHRRVSPAAGGAALCEALPGWSAAAGGPPPAACPGSLLSRLPDRASGRLLLDLDLGDHRFAVGDPRARTGRPGWRVGPSMNFWLLPSAVASPWQTIEGLRGSGALVPRSTWRPGEGPAAGHGRRAHQQRDLLLRAESSPARHERLLSPATRAASGGDRTPLCTRCRTGLLTGSHESPK